MYTACTRNTEKNLISVFMVFLSLSLFSFGRKQAQAGSAGTSFQEKKKKERKKKEKIRRKENRGTDGSKHSQNLHDEKF